MQSPEASPCDVAFVPGFDKGWVSVQDAAQLRLSVDYLTPKDGRANPIRLLCSPGGKTAHSWNTNDDTEVVAIDCDIKRLDRVYDNLERLQLRADVICGDALATLKSGGWATNLIVSCLMLLVLRLA